MADPASPGPRVSWLSIVYANIDMFKVVKLLETRHTDYCLLSDVNKEIAVPLHVDESLGAT